MDLAFATRHVDLDQIAMLLAEDVAHIVRVVAPQAAGELVAFDLVYDQPEAAQAAINAYARGEQLINLRDFAIQRRRLARLARDARGAAGMGIR